MNMSGEAAAVLTAVCWSLGSVLFTFSGRRIGSATVNRVRLWLALFLLLGLHALMFGRFFPEAEPEKFFWLGLSGLVGYVAGDGMLFESFVLIGPRLAMLMMTMVPIFSTILAWFFLAEHLAVIEIAAIVATLVGIAWVVSEKRNRQDPCTPDKKQYGLGILLGMGGALGQAVGLLFAKKGLANDFSAVSGNLIRVAAASLGIALISLLRRDLPRHIKKLKDKKALHQVVWASFLGPVIGVVLSLYAIAHTEIGIASTLMSLSPIFLLPLSSIFFKETITSRAIIGTIIAFAASALFFFV